MNNLTTEEVQSERKHVKFNKFIVGFVGMEDAFKTDEET